MPNVALHCHLAERVLEHWQASSPPPPFRVDAATRNAFLHGSVGPDMGYFPGADSLVSRLAHYARTAALTRALAAEARTDVERAYAWGWATHVLADVAIHPLVNEAAGEMLLGERGSPLSPDQAPAAHVSVEIGLDAFQWMRAPALRQLRLSPVFGPRGVRFLLRAYRRTYGAAPHAAAVLAAHQTVCRTAGPLFTLNRAAARIFHLRRGGAFPRLLGAGLDLPLALLRAACPRGSHAQGLFTPVHPPEWLVDAVDTVAERFAVTFLGHYGTGLALLADHDLDTGAVSLPDCPRARETVAELHAANGTPLRGAAEGETGARVPSSGPPRSSSRVRRRSVAPAG